MKKKHLQSVLQLTVIPGTIVAFGYYLYINSDQYLNLLNISLMGVLGLFLLSIAFPILNGIQNTLLYRGLGMANFSYWDGFLVTAASTLANQLPIPGGIVSKGYYLKRRYDLSYTKFASTTIASFFYYFSINGFVGTLVLLYWGIIERISIPFLLFIVFGGMAASILIFWLPIENIRTSEKLQSLTRQAIEGWTTMKMTPNLMFQQTILQVLLLVFLSIRYWIAFHMISQEVTLSQSLLFASASILTQLVSIAPGGLGVREAIVTALATLLGFDVITSVAAISFDRIVITGTIVLLGWVSIAVLGKQMAHEPVERLNS